MYTLSLLGEISWACVGNRRIVNFFKLSGHFPCLLVHALAMSYAISYTLNRANYVSLEKYLEVVTV